MATAYLKIKKQSIAMDNQRVGILNSFGVFFSFGLFLPISLKALGQYDAPISAMSIRIFWVFAIVFIVQTIRGKLNVILSLFNLKTLLLMLGAALSMSVVWFSFIYAIQIHQLNQAALGYYILPLIGVLAGVVFYQEKLNKKQLFALFLGAVGILWSLYVTGSVPIISLGMALGFTAYGMIKRNIQIEPLSGLLLETMLMAVFAPLIYYIMGQFELFAIMPSAIEGYLPAFFVAMFTILPLFFFARAIQQIDFSLYMVLSWLTPTIQFLASVIIWHEDVNADKLITFAFIWAALAIYGYSLFEGKKAKKA